ncbi:MAG: hypothetical protein H2057_01490 [Alphaproteobacteria bacterium]|nr:hypothetical protein [Alphaproteobacteria bacterium]
MTKKHVVFSLALLFAGLNFLDLSTCKASSTVLDAQEEPNTTHIAPTIPADVVPLILSHLSAHDFISFARTCKAFTNTYEKHSIPALQNERTLMLYDEHHWSSMLSASKLSQALNDLLQSDGFAFIPFVHPGVPAGSVPLSFEDVEALFPALYTHAFGSKNDALSPRDLLCLEAVLPWSRVVFKEGDAASKKKALACLTDIPQNTSLVRFLPDLKLEDFKATPHTLILTTEELAAHHEAVNAFAKTHPHHRVHLLVEKGTFVKDKTLSLKKENIAEVRHLSLSDPKGLVKIIGKFFLRRHEHLQTLDPRGLNTVKVIERGFASQCPALVSINNRGFSSVKEIRESFFYLNKSTTCFDSRGLENTKIIRGSFICSNPSLEQLNLRAFGAVEFLDGGFVSDCPALKLKNIDLSHLTSVTEIRELPFKHSGVDPETFHRRLCAFYREMEKRTNTRLPDSYYLPIWFSADAYLVYHPDVLAHAEAQSLDPEKYAKTHYISQGMDQNLPCRKPNDFEAPIYFLFNPDIKEVAYTQKNPYRFALWHFMIFGTKENRIYQFHTPEGFTPAGYLAHNPDLEAYAKSNTVRERDLKLKIHYTRHGQHEGRKF